MTRPSQRPEGALIESALEAMPGLSATKAAERAGMSEARWRQIVKGYISHGSGQYAEVVAPAARLARMASVVGVTPEQLENADRPDAADALRNLRPVALPANLPPGDLPAQIRWVRQQPWPPSEQQLVINDLIQLAAEVEQERRAAG